MVVSLVPKLVSKGKGKEKEREVVVLKKKTFHRYTSAFPFPLSDLESKADRMDGQRGRSREEVKALAIMLERRQVRVCRSVDTTRMLYEKCALLFLPCH